MRGKCAHRRHVPRMIPAALLLMLTGFGCVSVETPREEFSRTRLTMAKDIHGVQLQWISDAKRRYALMYRDPNAGDPRWQLVKGYEEIRGTGKLISIRFDDPSARTREYRLQTLVGVNRTNVP